VSSALLLGPDARRAVLTRTFLDPAREFHLRRLVRLTGFAPRTVQLEVEKLVAGDLLVERRDGNRRYLKANERHPLFRAVREIVLKTDGLGDVLRDALGTEDIDFACVFGSMASAAATAGSDVDLLVVGDLGLEEAVRRLAPVHDVLGREVNPIAWTLAEFHRRRNEGDEFVTRLLHGPLITVIGAIPEGPE
jgi:predicted nucleotidyltransferase